MGTSKVFKYESLKEEDFAFPIVARARNSTLIVLFSSYTTGTVLIENSTYKVGQVRNTWTNCFDATSWQILFEVTITFKS